MEHNEGKPFKQLPVVFLQRDFALANMTERPAEVDDVMPPVVSDDILQYIYTINYSIICGGFSLFGMVTNVINISVFVRMKFKKTVNIALLGLAISDMVSVTSLLWACICYNPLFMYSDVPILTFEIQHKTGGWTHIVFTRVTAFITTYITLERCLCIAFPLKIKTLLTPKRVMGIITAIYVVIIASLSPNYANFKFVWKFASGFNKTMLGMVYTDNRLVTQRVAYIFNVFCVIVPFVCVVIFSAILIWKLNERGKWLNSVSAKQNKTKTSRDSQVIRLVTVVALVFITTFTPSVVFFLTIISQPELNVGKTYNNLFLSLLSVALIFEALNSSVNIFVYYNMNSKFASTFRSMFLFCRNNRLS